MIDVIQSGLRYIFISEWVGETLSELPTLAAALGDPAAEGKEAVHFPQARATPRQFYRLLTAAHMPHMLGLLRRIEFVYERGWQNDQFLGTASRAQLRGGIAEALVVESLLLSGFQIAPVERGSGRSPDIAATQGELRALVEVYAPRTWQGLFDFIDGRVAALHAGGRGGRDARRYRRARPRQRDAGRVCRAAGGACRERPADSGLARHRPGSRARRRLQDSLGLARRRHGDTLLVQAGSSGTGQAAIDIGRHLGATVYATASESKHDRLRQLGAQPLAYDDERIAQLEAAVVFDPVGGAVFERSLTALAPGGRLVTPGAVESPTVSLNLWTVIGKRARIIGTGAGSVTSEEFDHLIELAGKGELSPVIDRELPLAAAAEAHRPDRGAGGVREDCSGPKIAPKVLATDSFSLLGTYLAAAALALLRGGPQHLSSFGPPPSPLRRGIGVEIRR